jgi:hypothetical protein
MSTIAAAKKELEGYLELGAGWDLDRGVPPNPEHVKHVMRFIDGLPDKFEAPTPMLGSSGTVGLYWHERPYYFDLEVEADGCISILISVATSTIVTNKRKESWWPHISVEEAVAIYTAHMEYWLMELNGVVGLMP